MPASKLDREAPPHPFLGFRSNADDTPRDLYGEPLLETPEDIPQGFEAIAPQEARDSARLREVEVEAETGSPSYGLGRIAAVGLIVLLAAGAGFTLTRGGRTSTSPAMTLAPTLRTAPAEPASPPVKVAAALPHSVPAGDPTRSPTIAAKAVRAAVEASALRPEHAVRSYPRFVDPQVATNASAITSGPAAPLPPPSAPAAAPVTIRPAFDCAAIRLTRAQVMVCGDPRLAMADQELNRAYAAALAAGGPQDDLRSDQADWLEIREDAARYSSRAVLNIYEQRTRELEALAGEAPE